MHIFMPGMQGSCCVDQMRILDDSGDDELQKCGSVPQGSLTSVQVNQHVHSAEQA